MSSVWVPGVWVECLSGGFDIWIDCLSGGLGWMSGVWVDSLPDALGGLSDVCVNCTLIVRSDEHKAVS